MLTVTTIAVIVSLAVAPLAVRAPVCTAPTKCHENMRGIRARGEPQELWLSWRCDADRAAVALLMRTLTQLGYCRIALCEARQGPCMLLIDKKPNNTLIVGVEKSNMTKCTKELLLFGVGQLIAPAPVLPHLHVHLSTDAKRRVDCAGAVTTRFYKQSNEEELRACGFSSPMRYYVPHEWSNAKAAPTAPLTLELLDVKLERINCTRGELVHQVTSPDSNSFLFLDSELWGGLDLVGVVRAAFPHASPAVDTELLAPVLQLQQHEPLLLRVLQEYAPEPQQLRELLDLEMKETVHDNAGERTWQTVMEKMPLNNSSFKTSKRPKSGPELYRVVAFMCKGNMSDDGYALVKEIETAMFNATAGDDVMMYVVLERIDCLDSFHLRDFLNWYMQSLFSYRLLGAAVVGAGVAEVAKSEFAAKLPLVAYDTQPSTEHLLAVGARADDVAQALLDVLKACGWRRVAVLSEESPTAKRVARVLLSKLGPLVVEERLGRGESEVSVRARLHALRSRDARVFVVTADGSTAARVLAAAHAMGLTECAWVVREWNGGAPPLTMLALRLGAHRHAHLASGAKWWPPHKAPLADALLTLAVAFIRVLHIYPEIRFDHQVKSTPELFHKELDSFVAEPSNLLYDVQKAHAPPLGLELWFAGDNEPVWQTSNLSECAPFSRHIDDGAVHCDLPYGASFSPLCLDTAVVCAVPSLLLAALVAGHGYTVWRRKARARRAERARRVRAKAAADLVVRQGECVAALVPWLVERDTVHEVRPLGAGRFGRVWLAALGAGRYAAAKEPHAGTGPGEEGALLLEAAMLARLRHDRVVRLLGVCVGGGAPLALTEPAFFGDLQSYLRSRRPLLARASLSDEARHVSGEALTRLAREAALALAYLARCRVVHCDVRAANCLVDERHSLKLADFGMARSTSDGGGGGDGVSAAGGEYACRRRALFPVLWMAPESLARGVFSHASDVWALGVLALELVTLGARPFGALEARAVLELVVRGGHARLPMAASTHTRRLARACWRRQAQDRPTAEALAAWLAERPCALQPAPDWDAHEEDGDSGFVETPTSETLDVDPLPDTDLDPT